MWEGFGLGMEVNRDIVVMAWHGSSIRRRRFWKAGYKIINVPWTPGIYHTVKEVYQWNLYHLNLNEQDQSVQVPPTPNVCLARRWYSGSALPMRSSSDAPVEGSARQAIRN